MTTTVFFYSLDLPLISIDPVLSLDKRTFRLPLIECLRLVVTPAWYFDSSLLRDLFLFFYPSAGFYMNSLYLQMYVFCLRLHSLQMQVHLFIKMIIIARYIFL